MTIPYIDSYYSRTLVDDTARPALQENLETEVCVIGGGLAGLAVALGLLRRGKRVTVLESKRIGFGASGRNGGFVLTGYAADLEGLVKKVGMSDARALYDLTKNARALIRKRIEDFKIDCHPMNGHLLADWYNDSDILKKKAEFYSKNFGETVEYWPQERVKEICVNDRYYGGLFFSDHFHIHPLNYLHGIAAEIEKQGGWIFEGSPAIRLDNGNSKTVYTPEGSIKADHVVFCGSAYFNALNKKLSRSCLPVSTYVMVTEPVPELEMAKAIKKPYAIRDNRWADDYYRLLPDGQLLWGGRVGLAKGPSPRELEKIMMEDLLGIYPQLKGCVKPSVAWSGLMGYTTHKMPHIGRLKEGMWYCTNFGGNGVGPTTAGGEVIAAAIAEDDERYKLFEPFGFGYTGGPVGSMIARMVYRSWEIADKIREKKISGKAV